MTYSFLFATLWGAWFVSWIAAAFWASRAAKRPARGQERLYWLLTAIGAALLYLNFRTGDGVRIEWTMPDAKEWVLFGVAAVGLAFTWWARIHLGTLWSGSVTRKSDHRIVDTGPYSIVRHPIYTGLLMAIYATALLRPGWFGLAAAIVLTIAFVMKLRLEERFLSEELGAESYARYRRKVAMLVPFWTGRR